MNDENILIDEIMEEVITQEMLVEEIITQEELEYGAVSESIVYVDNTEQLLLINDNITILNENVTSLISIVFAIQVLIVFFFIFQNLK